MLSQVLMFFKKLFISKYTVSQQATAWDLLHIYFLRLAEPQSKKYRKYTNKNSCSNQVNVLNAIRSK